MTKENVEIKKGVIAEEKGDIRIFYVDYDENVYFLEGDTL